MILNSFGRGPDLYVERINATLINNRGQVPDMRAYIEKTCLVYDSTTFGSNPNAGSGLSGSTCRVNVDILATLAL